MRVDGATGGATGGVVDGATGAVGGVVDGTTARSTARPAARAAARVGGATGGVDSLLNGGSLLDANVNIHANANLAAPIDGAVAANANVAAPIDAAVAANIGSDHAVAEALAPQEVNITQHLDDVEANATAAAGRHRRPAVATDGGRAGRMSATADRPAASRPTRRGRLRSARVEGLELLGEVSGSGYKDGAALVRRADGQMVQLGPLMYALLEEIDGERDHAALADGDVRAARARARRGARRARSAEKLAEQGLLAGSEENAPPRS